MRFYVGLAGGLTLVASFVGEAQAHPGHSVLVVPAESGWHYFLQPEHAVFPLFACATLGAWLAWRVACQRRQLSLLPVRRDR